MKNIFLSLAVVFTPFLFAGTPHVAELKLVTDFPVELSENGMIPDIVFYVYGEKNNPVIPSEWYAEPALPEGLYIERGEGIDNNKIYIKGKAEKETRLTRYKIYALNNGNKVKNIPAGSASIDIVVHKKSKLFTIDEFEIENVSIPQLDKKTFSSYRFISLHSNIIYAKNKIAFINLQGDLLVVFDPKSQIYKEIPIPKSRKWYLFFDGENVLAVNDETSKKSLIKVELVSDSISEAFLIFPNEKSFSIKDILYVDHHYVFVINKSIGHELWITKSKFEIILKRDVLGLMSGWGVNKNKFFFMNKGENKIKLLRPEGQEIKEIDIPHFKIDLHLHRNKIKYFNNCFVIKTIDPFHREHHLIKIVDAFHPDFLPFRVGEYEPLDFAYGNGFLAVITNNQFILFDWEMRQKIHVQDFESGLKEVYFSDDHFIVRSTHNLYSFHPGTNQVFSIRTQNEIFAPLDNQNFLALFGNALTNLFDLNSLKLTEHYLAGCCVAITENYVVTYVDNKIFFYSGNNCDLLKELALPSNISSITYDKKNRHLLVTCENMNSLFILSQDFALQEHIFSNVIYKTFTYENLIFALADEKIDVFNMTNKSDVKSIPLPLHVLNKSFSFHIQDTDTQTIVICKMQKGKKSAFVVDKKQQKIQYVLKDFFDQILLTDTAILIYKSGDQLCFLNLQNEEIKKITHPSFSFIKNMVFGNNRVVLTTETELIVVDCINFLVTEITGNFAFANAIFFADNKFFMQQTDLKLLVLDGIHNKLLGNIRLDFFVDSVTDIDLQSKTGTRTK